MFKSIIAIIQAIMSIANFHQAETFTFDSTEVGYIIAENYAEYPIDWEITSINGEICCLYEVEVTEKTELTLLLDFGNFAETLLIEVDQAGTQHVQDYIDNVPEK